MKKIFINGDNINIKTMVDDNQISIEVQEYNMIYIIKQLIKYIPTDEILKCISREDLIKFINKK